MGVQDFQMQGLKLNNFQFHRLKPFKMELVYHLKLFYFKLYIQGTTVMWCTLCLVTLIVILNRMFTLNSSVNPLVCNKLTTRKMLIYEKRNLKSQFNQFFVSIHQNIFVWFNQSKLFLLSETHFKFY